MPVMVFTGIGKAAARAGFATLAGLALAGAAASCAGPPARAGEGEPAACARAALSDGDSLHCESGERVRLLLIDAPEMAQRPWGDSARAALGRLLPRGVTVRLEYDAEKRDDFGRLLAYAWLDDGRMVNEEMARGGYVVRLAYRPNVRHRARIEAAIADAVRARRGLWSTGAFDCLPVDFRARRCPAARRGR